MKILTIFQTFLYIISFLKKQKKINQSVIPAFTQKFYSQFNTQLSPTLEKKITNYYCLGVPIITESFAILQRGSKLSKKENLNTILMGIIIPIFDDFTDENLLDFENQLKLILTPNDFETNTLETVIVKECLLKIEVINEKKYLEMWNRLIFAQKDSINQTSKNITTLELERIMEDKSISSQLLFYLLLDVKYDEKIAHVIALCSSLLQLANDCFDVYKDYHAGIKTLANTCKNFDELENYYLTKSKEFCQETRALSHCKKENIEFFITLVSLILARGLTVIQQHNRLQKKMNCELLPYDKLERKHFIGDMEKPINSWKVLKNTYKIIS